MSENGKWNNFLRALARLKEAADEFKNPSASEVVRDGLIQRFEFTYELAWKTTKEYLEEVGVFECNSPKMVFKEAFSQKLVTNEKVWLTMISDRNKTTHIYREDVAREIALRIVDCYIGEFTVLLEKLRREE